MQCQRERQALTAPTNGIEIASEKRGFGGQHRPGLLIGINRFPPANRSASGMHRQQEMEVDYGLMGCRLSLHGNRPNYLAWHCEGSVRTLDGTRRAEAIRS